MKASKLHMVGNKGPLRITVQGASGSGKTAICTSILEMLRVEMGGTISVTSSETANGDELIIERVK